MKKTVVGKEVVDYTKNGEHVQAVRLHCTYEDDKAGLEGVCVETLWFGSKYPLYTQALPVQVGDVLDVFYNQYGRVDTFQIVPPSPAPADKK